ncbi:unnamed protein product [Ectocarpus sp. CCAP 1310/34]|nr:unnamed protein product [Ectocarpus sp. CCAP 1310/34]
MATEGRIHVRGVGYVMALSLLACRCAVGFVALPSTAVRPMRQPNDCDERSSKFQPLPQVRTHRARQRTNNPAARTTLLRHRCRQHDLQHHQRCVPAAALRTAAFSGWPTTDRRNRNSNAKKVAGVLSTAEGRLCRLFAAADPSSAAEPAEEGDASTPETPLPPAAAAVSSDANRKSVSLGESDAATSQTGGEAGAAAAAAAAIVSIEDKGTGGGRGRGKGVAVTEGKRKQAAGPPAWAPRWAVDMHPAGQAAVSIGLYFFHMARRRCVRATRVYRLGALGELPSGKRLHLSKSGLTFPIQLIPNNHGLFHSVGLDTAAGFAVLGVAAWSRVRSGLPLFPPLGGRGVEGKEKGRGKAGAKSGTRGRVKIPWKLEGARVKKKLPLTFTVLIFAYFLSGLGSTVCEYLLYGLSYLGVGMSVAMHRSLQVLLSHLVWVYMGVRILSMAVRSFFDTEKASVAAAICMIPSELMRTCRRFTSVLWVVGGYFVSSSLFNMADLANQFLCPLPPDTESVVVKIINPENNDIAAMAVGSIAPCMTAPWWEEVLYRG